MAELLVVKEILLVTNTTQKSTLTNHIINPHQDKVPFFLNGKVLNYLTVNNL